ncbi:alkaline shock response membrane anchor protein AmaP [Paenibacillus beijingensis]|uniref:Alkaline shock response membrane anchor protein AmaP n=1 Tax=Paenibacillus beijingensis TaxID=1126833 RepID=A0A0D5NQJ9_9BACL|nr:alkaline shock response membrane anchor protein AmaP [Paenibacillus beijingensis]AJY77257.1 hypothetical protein VN24_25245 [Paenibacillus beijingensis]
MGKIVDKFLLFLYSLVIAVVSVIVFLAVVGAVPNRFVGSFIREVYVQGSVPQVTVIALTVVVFIISLRLLAVSISRGSSSAPSIDQRTDFGDIRISLETVENLTLKAASRQRCVKDMRARIRIEEAGLDIAIRTVVDGETSIPVITEDIQRAVKEHVEEITGIPVANVSVFVANIIQSAAFKSRVE